MFETTVINSSGHKINLKSGSAGVYQSLKRLADGQHHVLKIDRTVTYHDYVVFVLDGSKPPTAVFISFDECIKYNVMTVVGEALVDADKLKGVIELGSKYGYNREERPEERPMKGEASGSAPWWQQPWKTLRDLSLKR